MVTTTTGIATEFIQFTRASNATLTDSDGKIKWAPHNLLTYSEQFDAWTFYSATVSANSGVAPNGTTTADKFLEANGSSIQARYLVSSSIQAGTVYTYSVYAKAAERSYINMSLSTVVATEWVAATFDLTGVTSTQNSSSGTGYAIVGSPSITSVGGGWYRCVLSFTVGNSAPHYCYMGPGISGTPTYGSFGLVTYSGTVTNGAFFWGASLYRSDLGGMQPNTSAYPLYNPTTPKNLLGYSEDFSNAAWTKLGLLAFGSGSVANTVVAPNGLQTADLIVEDTSTGYHETYMTSSLTLIAGTQYTVSVYCRSYSNGRYLNIAASLGGATRAFSVRFDPLTNTVSSVYIEGSAITGASASSVPVGGGWYRVNLTFTAVSGSTSFALELALANTMDAPSAANYGLHSYTGDGSSGIYLWGAQLSDSASLDAYVPSYGAAPTAAAYYGPRRDFESSGVCKGLLVEELRTNLLLYTAAFDNAYWAKYALNTTGTPAWVNVGVAPDGTSTAEKLIDTTAVNDTPLMYHTDTLTAAAYTFSIYAKAAERSIIYLRLDTGGAKYAYFNLSTGIASNVNAAYTATIAPVGNGWYRCSVTTTATVASYTSVIGLAVTAGTPTYTGDGTSGALVWGAQLEAGSFATSYIPTGAATATRVADVASVSTQAFPYSSTEGSWVVYASFQQTTGVVATILNDGNVAISASPATATESTMRVYKGTAPPVNLVNGANITSGTLFKYGAAYITGSNASSFVKGATINAFTNPDLVSTIVYLGDGTGLGAYGFRSLNGYIRQITYIPRKLTNTELQTRTA